MKRIATLLCAVLVFPLTACKTVTATAPAAPLPGACNAADSTMYQALTVAQASLLSLEATMKNTSTASATVATLKPYVAQAVVDYNIAEAAWQGYHAACITNPALSPASAQAAVNTLQTAVSATPKVNP